MHKQLNGLSYRMSNLILLYLKGLKLSTAQISLMQLAAGLSAGFLDDCEHVKVRVLHLCDDTGPVLWLEMVVEVLVVVV